MAITNALRVLGYYEAAEDEVPSEDIWHHASRLEEWFAAVEQRRKTGHTPIEEPDDAELMENDLVRELMEGPGGG